MSVSEMLMVGDDEDVGVVVSGTGTSASVLTRRERRSNILWDSTRNSARASQVCCRRCCSP